VPLNGRLDAARIRVCPVVYSNVADWINLLVEVSDDSVSPEGARK